MNARPPLGVFPATLVPVLRISWPLALLLAAVIALVARRPQLFLPMLVVFGIWFMVERARTSRRR